MTLRLVSSRSKNLLKSLRRIMTPTILSSHQQAMVDSKWVNHISTLRHHQQHCITSPNQRSFQKKFLHSESDASSSSTSSSFTIDNLVHESIIDENREVKINSFTDDGIVKISLNRTKKANAMGKTMLSQLQDVIKTLNEDSNARCVILTSQSDKIFSAGADLKERSKMTKDEASLFVSKLRSTFDDLANLPMPLIACVEGFALGGGLEIALTADIVIAGKKAMFGLPETSLAIIPGAGGTQRLPRLIGAARAKELIFTGKRIDSRTALEYGMVQYEVNAGETEDKAVEIACQIASNGPLAIRAAKKSINEGIETDLHTGMQIEKNCYGLTLTTADRLEGLLAFKEKRKPCYTGK